MTGSRRRPTDEALLAAARSELLRRAQWLAPSTPELREALLRASPLLVQIVGPRELDAIVALATSPHRGRRHRSGDD